MSSTVRSLHFAFAAGGLLAQASAANPKRMNVLVLCGDDGRHDTLGGAGNPVVKPPNLDGLAAEGVRFMHHGVTISIGGVNRPPMRTRTGWSWSGNDQ